MKTLSILAALLVAAAPSLDAQVTSVFNYQGQLYNAGAPANGAFDLQFTLFDAATDGNRVGDALTNTALAISNGLFTVPLDFGAGAFSGPPRWLQVGARSNGSGGEFFVLTPRQQIGAAPYAIMANNASNLLGTVSASQISGTLPATQLSGTLFPNQLPPEAVTNNQNNVTLGGVFSGNAAGLTNLNPSALSGPVGLAQMPAAVITNGQTFVGLNGDFSGFFSGNGNGLDSLNAGTLVGAVPPGDLTSVPAGNLTGTVPGGALSGIYGKPVFLTNTGNLIAGNGAGLTEGAGQPFGTAISNLALSIGANGTNFSLTTSNSLQLAASNSVNLALDIGANATNFSLATSNSVLLAAGNSIRDTSNSIQAQLLLNSSAYLYAVLAFIPPDDSLTLATFPATVAIPLRIITGPAWSVQNGTNLVPALSGTYLVNYSEIFETATDYAQTFASAGAAGLSNSIPGSVVFDQPPTLTQSSGTWAPFSTSFIVTLGAGTSLNFAGQSGAGQSLLRNVPTGVLDTFQYGFMVTIVRISN